MVYGIIALLALLVDQFLKFWTVSNVALNTGIRPLIPGFLHITYIKNFGAAFGVMSSFGALRWILLILLIAFTALMVFAFMVGHVLRPADDLAFVGDVRDFDRLGRAASRRSPRQRHRPRDLRLCARHFRA